MDATTTEIWKSGACTDESPRSLRYTQNGHAETKICEFLDQRTSVAASIVSDDVASLLVTRARARISAHLLSATSRILRGREHEQILGLGIGHPMTPEANRTSILGEPCQSVSRG